MEPHFGDASLTMEEEDEEVNEFADTSFTFFPKNDRGENVDRSLNSGRDSDNAGDPDDKCSENPSNQIVLYDPTAHRDCKTELTPEPIQLRFLPFGKPLDPNAPPRVLPSIGAFTVQCAECFKWRLIPTKEKYEEIRECILEKPFFCKTALEWRPDVSCDDPTDVTQDDSLIWAIDKPNIAQPPPGWRRLLRIRGEGGSNFADVYYQAPTGKTLRSLVEVRKYLSDHPEYVDDGVTLAQFSFKRPKPLQENYVRRTPKHKRPSLDTHCFIDTGDANPLLCVGPDDPTEHHRGMPALPPPPPLQLTFTNLTNEESEENAPKRVQNQPGNMPGLTFTDLTNEESEENISEMSVHNQPEPNEVRRS